jgi:hypothetical protein
MTPRSRARLRFDGWIAGVGTSSGVRIVVGRWPASPFGAFADVMVERADGHRMLLAPTAEVGEFVAATYRFDAVHVGPVRVEEAGTAIGVEAGPLTLRLTTGRRTALGWLLRLVPPAVATAPAWAAAVDPFARLLLPGVRTAGTAGGGRREFYGARDVHTLAAAGGALDGRPLGHLADLAPPVRFGFGSAPRRPSIVRLRTTVEGT